VAGTTKSSDIQSKQTHPKTWFYKHKYIIILAINQLNAQNRLL